MIELQYLKGISGSNPVRLRSIVVGGRVFDEDGAGCAGLLNLPYLNEAILEKLSQLTVRWGTRVVRKWT